jgi:xylulokinase
MPGDSEAPLLIGVDVGTQSVRAVVFDRRGHKVAEARRPTPETHPAPGQCEYVPEGLFAAVTACLAEVARTLAGRPVAGIAAASVGESCVLMDAAGRPLAPAIAWFDLRAEEAARRLRDTVGVDRIFQVTGLQIDPIFTLCKLLWMREHWPDAMQQTRRILHVADWIAYRLSGVAATDLTLASRTLYLDLRKQAWSEELIGLAGLDTSVLAPLTASGTPLGPVLPEVLEETGLAGQPTVAVGAHDHFCGAIATGATTPGTMIDSIGTAEALVLATTRPSLDPGFPKSDLIQGVLAPSLSLYYVGASLARSGGAVEWFRNVVGNPSYDTLIEEGEAAIPGSRGVVFLPHLVEPSPPDPDHPVRGSFLGLTAGATRGMLYRAVLEGLAMQTAHVTETIASLPGIQAPTRIRLIGGGSRNPLFAAIKANTYGHAVTVVDETEATALGAALFGGVGAGLWPDIDAAVGALDRREHSVEPDAKLAELYRGMREYLFGALQETLRPVDLELAQIAKRSAQLG